jgi:hypothetical protein
MKIWRLGGIENDDRDERALTFLAPLYFFYSRLRLNRLSQSTDHMVVVFIPGDSGTEGMKGFRGRLIDIVVGIICDYTCIIRAHRGHHGKAPVHHPRQVHIPLSQ